MTLVKHATVLVPYGVSMHVKEFSDRIQYGRQACVKVSPQLAKNVAFEICGQKFWQVFVA